MNSFLTKTSPFDMNNITIPLQIVGTEFEKFLTIRSSQPGMLKCPNKAGIIILVPTENDLVFNPVKFNPAKWDIMLVKMGTRSNIPGGTIEVSDGVRESSYDAMIRELHEETLGRFKFINTQKQHVDFYYTSSNIHYSMSVYIAVAPYATRDYVNHINSKFDDLSIETCGVELTNLHDIIKQTQRIYGDKSINRSMMSDSFNPRKPYQRVYIAIARIFGKYSSK